MNNEEKLEHCQEMIDYKFKDISHLKLALTHPSCSRSLTESYERLEFLGDSVLGLSVCTALYDNFPDLREGDMTKIKSTVVSRKTCAKITRSTGMIDTLFIGNEMPEIDRLPESIAAALFESIIGAIYIDGGYEPASEFVNKYTMPLIIETQKDIHGQNAKSFLQQYAQKEKLPAPEYILLDEKGPDHNKCFEIAVAIGNTDYPSAWDLNKKDAEQSAAKLALIELGIIEKDQ